jgi:hypothetical protein
MQRKSDRRESTKIKPPRATSQNARLNSAQRRSRGTGANTARKSRIDDRCVSRVHIHPCQRRCARTSTWAMATLGFAGLGYAGYRRAKRGAVTSV